MADWRAAYASGKVVTRDLMETDLRFATAPWLQTYLALSEHHSPEMKDALRPSDQLVGEIFATDCLDIATLVYNYNIPAALKA